MPVPLLTSAAPIPERKFVQCQRDPAVLLTYAIYIHSKIGTKLTP